MAKIKKKQEAEHFNPTPGIPFYPLAVALLAILVSVSFSTQSQNPTIDIKWLILQEGVFFLALAWLIRGFITKRKIWISHPWHFPLLIYFLITLLAILRPANRGYLGDSLFQLLALVLLYQLVAQNTKTVSGIKVIIHGLLIGGSLCAIYGIIQKIGWDPIPWDKAGNIGNISSTLGNSNLFGWYLAGLMPLSLAIIFISPANRLEKILKILYPIFLMVALLVVKNRAGVVAVIGSSIILLLLILQDRKISPNPLFPSESGKRFQWLIQYGKPILSIIGILFLSGILFFGYRYIAKSDIAIKNRLLHWKTSILMFKNHPVLGIGPGNYPIQYLESQGQILVDPRNSGFVQISQEVQSINTLYAHNDFIQELTDKGILGFAAFLFFILTVLFVGYKDWIQLKERNIKWIFLGCYWGVVSFLIAAFFGFPFQVPASAMQFWIFLGLMVAIRNQNIRDEELFWPKAIQAKPWIPLAGFTVMLVLPFLLLWGSYRQVNIYRASLAIREGRYWAENDGNFQEAAASMQKAIRLNPVNGQAHYFLGGYLARMQQYQPAIEEYQKSLNSYNDIHIYYNLGQIYFNLKDYPKAEEYYKKTLSLNESFYSAYRQLGIIAVQNNDFPKAVIEFKKYLEYEKTGEDAQNIRALLGELEKTILEQRGKP